VVRFKRPCIGATRNGVEHGRFDFQEIVSTALLRATKRWREVSSVIRST
jgi:hypothetical protein